MDIISPAWDYTIVLVGLLVEIEAHCREFNWDYYLTQAEVKKTSKKWCYTAELATGESHYYS